MRQHSTGLFELFLRSIILNCYCDQRFARIFCNIMPKRVEYFGGAKELHPEELPSIRDVICFAKSLQDSLPGKSLGLASNEIGIS